VIGDRASSDGTKELLDALDLMGRRVTEDVVAQTGGDAESGGAAAEDAGDGDECGSHWCVRFLGWVRIRSASRTARRTP